MPSDPPAKPKLSPEENRARKASRLKLFRLRLVVGRELNDREMTAAASVGEAIGLPAAEATALLARKVFREADQVQLEAAASRLELQLPK